MVFRPAAGRRARPVKELPCHPVEGGGGHQGPDPGEQCATRGTLRRGGGAPEGQRPDSARVVQGQLKGNGSAHRHAINVGGRGAGCVEDRQRVACHQRHGVGPRRVGAATGPPVVEPDDAVGCGQSGGGAMPHVSPVGVAHDEQDRVARPALVPPDPGVRALGKWHSFPFRLVRSHHRLTIDRQGVAVEMPSRPVRERASGRSGHCLQNCGAGVPDATPFQNSAQVSSPRPQGALRPVRDFAQKEWPLRGAVSHWSIAPHDGARWRR